MHVDPVVLLTVTALLGLAAGSFLNVLVIRTHRATSPWRGRSVCTNCGHALAWFDLIPLVSFTALRGRCRYCQAVLSWQYPIVEAGTAALFALVTRQYGLTWVAVLGWLVVALMISIAVYDARWSLLPDNFSIVLAVVGFAFAVVIKIPIIDLALGLGAGVTFFGLQYYLSRRRWVGSGDVLLGGAMGVTLGWRMFGLSLLLAYLIGAVVAIGLIIAKRKNTKGMMAFGPYLVIGGFLAWLYGGPIIDWYFNHALFR